MHSSTHCARFLHVRGKAPANGTLPISDQIRAPRLFFGPSACALCLFRTKAVDEFLEHRLSIPAAVTSSALLLPNTDIAPACN